MDARQRWQALQARLKAARAAVDAGDRKRALAEIAAALELDKDFLAAHALRDRIESMTAEQWAAATTVAKTPPTAVATPTVSNDAIRPPAATAPLAPIVLPPAVPPGYAKFEQRARRRRVDRRVDAARAAIEQKRLRAAAAALDEVIELDPNLPELAELTAQFDELRRAVATPRRGPWVAAAAVFAIAVFGGTWWQSSQPVRSRQVLSAAPLPLPLATMVAATEPSSTVGTSGTVAADEPVPVVVAAPVDSPRLVNLTAPVAPATEQRPISSPPLRLAAMPVEAPLPPVMMDAAIGPVNTPTALPISMTIPPKVDSIDDNILVKQALQRYRSAYEGLDAQSAQAVWPAVNEAALARAFDGLESQSLTFEACDVRLRGEAATAICRGSARYVTKVGSRDPRVEPRTWNFTLRKTGSDWKIDSARAQK
jgi:tetratricopeptide (TPR) repeat protein